MKNFRVNFLKTVIALSVFIFNSVIVFGMESSVISNAVCLYPEKTIYIFNPQEELQRGVAWSKIVPGSMMLTPDGESVVMGRMNGKVERIYFTGDRETIIEHSGVQHVPLIALSKKDGSLFVVSAGNYINSVKNRVSEYILFCNGSSKVHNLDWPIQAIALDSSAQMLAIASKDFVEVINLETNSRKRAFSKNRHNESWITDIAMCEHLVIPVGNAGSVQCMSISKRNKDIDSFSADSYMLTQDRIKKVYYPNLKDVLYTTYDAKAKVIDFYDLLNAQDHDSKITSFSGSEYYDQVIASSANCVSTAHWAASVDAAANIRRKIEICRKGSEKNCTEKFILEVDDLEESYEYITESGTCEVGVGHLLSVALHGNHVVALGTDGKMRLWFLSEKKKLGTEPEIVLPIKKEVVPRKERSKSATYYKSPLSSSADAAELGEKKDVKRGRSDSAKSYKSLASSGDEPVDKPKKFSPRIFTIIAKSGHNSREGSPLNSPSHSPHRRESTVSFSADTINNSPESKSVKNSEEK